MNAPISLEQYERRMHWNTATTGEGIEGVTQHFPCPFCAARDWLVVRIIDFQQDHLATCGSCGRTAQLQFDRLPNGSSMRVVQTGGEDPPVWLVPAPPREEAR